MKAYKMMKKRADGTLGPLFINCRQRIPIDVWLPAEAHRKPGYAFRPGWHTLAMPVAPHLKLMKNRVWVEVDIEDYEEYARPVTQGGRWYLAQRMKVIGELGTANRNYRSWNDVQHLRLPKRLK